MAKVISFVSGKGGVGKTLGAILTAGEYAMRDQRVLVVDADPTERFSDWFQACIQHDNTPDNITVTKAQTGQSVKAAVAKAQADFDMVVIDAPGTEGAVNEEVLRQSDLVATPVKIGRDEVKAMAVVAADVASISDAVGFEIPHATYITELSEVHKSLTAYATLHSFVTKLRDEGYSTQTLKTQLYSRNVYKELRNGLGTLQMIEINPTIRKARLEIREFIAEFDAILARGKISLTA